MRKSCAASTHTVASSRSSLPQRASTCSCGIVIHSRSASTILLFPALGQLDHSRSRIGPVVKRRGVEVRTVRPDEGVCIRVDRDPLEHRDVAKRAVQFPPQYGLEIDCSLCPVIEPDVQYERTCDGERNDAVDGVVHPVLTHRNGAILSGARPACRSCQSVANSSRWIGSGFDEPLLCPWQVTADRLDGIDSEDGGRILVVRMEVRPMVRCARLGEHPDDDPVEPRNLRHSTTSRPTAHVSWPRDAPLAEDKSDRPDCGAARRGTLD